MHGQERPRYQSYVVDEEDDPPEQMDAEVRLDPRSPSPEWYGNNNAGPPVDIAIPGNDIDTSDSDDDDISEFEDPEPNEFDLRALDEMLDEFIVPNGAPPDNPIQAEEIMRLYLSRSEISLKDLSSFAWADLVLRYKISREAERQLRLFNSIATDANGTNIKPSEARYYQSRNVRIKANMCKRTAKKRLMALTGLRFETHGRCINNCMAFRDTDEVTHTCAECNEERFRVNAAGERVNRAVYWSIPVTPRLIAWYADSYKAELLQTYPSKAERSVEDHMYADFWSGRLYNDILKGEKASVLVLSFSFPLSNWLRDYFKTKLIWHFTSRLTNTRRSTKEQTLGCGLSCYFAITCHPKFEQKNGIPSLLV